MKRGVFAVLVLVLALVVGVSPLAADPVITRGIDVFTTTDSGTTYYSFADNPIPAGFFCKRSKPFAGRVTFKGLPLETRVPGQLRGADTVIERLDDAIFKADGTAVTRIRVRALSLVSVAPLKTACGAFHVYVSLAGEQRETTMRIVQTEKAGGSFYAPLAIDAKLTFIPVKPGKGRANARPLELVGSFNLPGDAIPWSFSGPPQAKRMGPVVIDTNGDLAPETRFSGTSNFAPGWPAQGAMMTKNCVLCEPETCHTDPSTQKQHCTGPVYACSGGSEQYSCP
jgi:hypothetical protein